MRLSSLLLIGLALGCCPILGEEEQKLRSFGLTVEWIEVDLKVLPGLLRKHGGDSDSSELYAEVEKLMEDGKAERSEIVYARGRFGDRLKAGSYTEQIYPTEYDPPEIPNEVRISQTSGDAVPRTGATPTAFETRNVGVTLEADVVQLENGNVSLNIAAEDVRLLGRDYHTNEKVKDSGGHQGVWMPKFYTMKVTSHIFLAGGGTILVGTFAPPEPDKGNRRKMLFLHVQPILPAAK